MALSSSRVSVGQSDTVIYTASANTEVHVRAVESKYVLIAWYKSGAYQNNQSLVNPGDSAVFAITSGDELHAVAPAGYAAIDVVAVV